MSNFNTALAEAIRPFLGGNPDGTYRLPKNLESSEDTVGEFEAFAAMAELLGKDISEFTSMSWLDLIEHVVVTAAEIEALKLKAYILQQDRLDLLEPWMAGT